MMLRAAVAALLVAFSAGAAIEPGQKMIMLPVTGDSAASCLDGSPYAFYIVPGSKKHFSIGLHGGGWCYTEQGCVHRAQTDLGTSKLWNLTSCHGPPAFSCNGLDANCTKVFLPYW